MIKPYSNDLSKKQQVKEMFDGIAPTYDFLNRFLSLGIDVGWRKKALKMLKGYGVKNLLDVATGTGDFAFMAFDLLKPNKIIGVDLSDQMLEIAMKKNKSHQIEFVYGDSEALPFANQSFDGAIVAFGVRNFENLELGLKEIHRVLLPGSPFMVLEFSKIEKFPMKQLFYLYSRYILPVIGKVFSMDFKAYHYLHESMYAFPAGMVFAGKLEQAGFTFKKLHPLSLGICTAYLSEK
jgi:demethylmenaquinone methyltransferase/2-methoxy-6-polyprenyl-1,4-benzoquinol methylase